MDSSTYIPQQPGVRSLVSMVRTAEPKLIALVTVTLAASVLILVGSWEIGGESSSYWMWARNLADNGTFNIASRSAVYALYLNAFAWLGYPASVTAEHLVSGLIVVGAMVILLRSFMGVGLALLTALLWLPSLQTAEPAVQKLALACAFLGVYLRTTGTGGGRLGGSYALLALAAMFRMPYVLFVVLFALWDVRQALKGGGLAGLVPHIPSLRAFAWPIVPVAGLLIWILLAQSAHPWNNISSSSTMWFPLSNPKSFSDSMFFAHFNQKYIEREYGTFRDQDWYLTNDEVFDGRTTALGAFLANPSFVIRQVAANVKPAIFISAKFTELWYLPLLRVYDSLLLAAIFVGAYFATKSAPVRIFVAGSIVLHAGTVAIMPGPYRHFVPFVPLLILAAYYYGSRLRAVLAGESGATGRVLLWAGVAGVALTTVYVPFRVVFAPQDASRLAEAAISAYLVAAFLVAIGAYGAGRMGAGRLVYGRLLGVLALAVPLVVLSNGATEWGGLARDFVVDARHGELRVLEYSEADSPVSMRASFEELKPLVAGCAGVMAREHTFVGAFMDMPLERLYDIMEIPPFGGLGDSEYDGLRPDRIDCVLVSDIFATNIGGYTNLQVRYENYVEPYFRQLQDLGAATYEIERFGRAVILPK